MATTTAPGCRCPRGVVTCRSPSLARPVPAPPPTPGAPTPMPYPYPSSSWFEHTSPDPALPDLDPRFVFDFRATDDPGEGQRFSTWLDVEPLCRGPEPRPDWVVTEPGRPRHRPGRAEDRQGGRRLPARAGVPDDPGQQVVMAAKRYRGEEHRSFHRSSAYTEGRRTRRSRDTRALAKKTAHGRAVAAGQWATAEWDALDPLLVGRHPGPLPGADRRHRDPDGAGHRGRRAGTAAGADPPVAPAARHLVRPAPRRDDRVRTARAWPTATCRRTTCWRRVSGWS